MRIDVAFLPSLLKQPERTTCIVIDVLRATSTLVTLAARGVATVTVVPELEQAFALKLAAERDRSRPVPLLCGEVRGLPPEGFDYGNSPEEFSRLDLEGRPVVLYTSNGTRALVSASAAAAVFVGALLNRSAAVESAMRFAGDHDLDLTVICSGTDLGTAFCLEDAFCAGAFVAGCLDLDGPSPVLGDAAQTALRLYQSFAGDMREAFAVAEHGGLLATIGLGADIEFCAQQDRYATVPRVSRHQGQVIVTTPDVSTHREAT
jgi:2-phosphosulfolactate phosphatase